MTRGGGKCSVVTSFPEQPTPLATSSLVLLAPHEAPKGATKLKNPIIEDTLLERIRLLHAQQKQYEQGSREYRRLSAEIREVSKAYCEALDAKSALQRLARKA